MSDKHGNTIVIKRIKKHAHGHHGGAWKVAYADFVTAMMAFFLLMWLMGSTTKEERAAISDYFMKPSLVKGSSPTPSSAPTAVQGPGGASTSMIKMGGAMNMDSERNRERAKPIKAEPGKEKTLEKSAPQTIVVKGEGKGADTDNAEAGKLDAKSIDDKSAEQIAHEQEQKRLEQLQVQLNAAIQASQALAPFKDQLLIDITPEGLRIQIIDAENRPMFDRGSSQLKRYSVDMLSEIASIINGVPNKISISGHTDATPFLGTPNYSNWELSSDRANAARRALVAGGMNEDKVERVVGLSSAVLFDKQDPLAATNRRISIIVMNRDLEESISRQEASASAPATTTAPGANSGSNSGSKVTSNLYVMP